MGVYALRTESHCKDLLDQHRLLRTKTARTDLETENSFHPVPSGLWGFKDGDTDLGSSSWVFASDGMHNDDLGVFVYIIKHMKVILTFVIITFICNLIIDIDMITFAFIAGIPERERLLFLRS